MPILERRDLGPAGLTFVRERLEGGKGLSALLLAHLQLASGSACAYLPPSMSETAAQQFNTAGLTAVVSGEPPERFVTDTGVWSPIRNLIDPWLSTFITRFIREHPGAIALWEDALKRPKDEWVQKHPEMPFLVIGDDLYYAFDKYTATEDGIRSAMGVMQAWWGSPAVLATPVAEQLTSDDLRRASISVEQLWPVVEHLQLLYFLAYDAEGFVFWSPLSSTLQMPPSIEI